MNYISGARSRAGRRRSAWNLLLLAAVVGNLVLLTAAGMYAIAQLHEVAHPGQTLAKARGLGVILSTLAVLFAAIPCSLLLANVQVHCVPAARRVLEEEAQLVKNTDYRASQRTLSKLALFIVPLCVVLAIAGALAPWRQ
jgi:hypothetical protein